jgi:hypothetical protein
MKAGALVVSLALMVVVPAGAQHGGGGHSGGFGGGHFGGHFGGHRNHGASGHWGSGRFSGSSALSHVAGSPRLTTFVGFGSASGFRFFFVADSFFCPFVPHRVSPFCRFCGLGILGFPAFGFFDGFGPWMDVYSQPAVAVPPPAGSSQPARSVLVFTNGWTFEVTDYWIDDEGELRYVTTYGGMNIADLQSLDLYATAKENAARGIPFILKVRHGQ